MSDQVYLKRPDVMSFVLLFERDIRGGSFGYYSKTCLNVDLEKMGVVTVHLSDATKRYESPGMAFRSAKSFIKTHANARVISVRAVFNGQAQGFIGDKYYTIRGTD